MKYSIVIPTYNRLNLLKTCLKSISETTNLTNDIEIIVVSNGCTDGTVEYVKALGEPYKIIHWPSPLGYSNATNLGYNVAKGDYIIRLDSDCTILGNGWIDLLEEPFKLYSTAGVTGPAVCEPNDSPYAGAFAVSFCTMIKRELFYKIGYLDPTYNVGGGEDTDFCMRAQQAGYTIHKAGYPISPDPADTATSFPIYHMPNNVRTGETHESMRKKAYSSKLLTQRYGKIKI